MSVILKRKTKEEIHECIEAQRKLCVKENYPDFAPSDGICWSCFFNIYQNYGHSTKSFTPIVEDGAEVDYVTGISLEKASKELITGCPHCHRSYCD